MPGKRRTISPFDSPSRTRESKRADKAKAREYKQRMDLQYKSVKHADEVANKSADREVQGSILNRDPKKPNKNPKPQDRDIYVATEKSPDNPGSYRDDMGEPGKYQRVDERFKKTSGAQHGHKTFGVRAGDIKKKTSYPSDPLEQDHTKTTTYKKRGTRKRTADLGVKKKEVESDAIHTAKGDKYYPYGSKTTTKSKTTGKRGNVTTTKTKGFTEKQQSKITGDKTYKQRKREGYKEERQERKDNVKKAKEDVKAAKKRIK